MALRTIVEKERETHLLHTISSMLDIDFCLNPQTILNDSP